MALLSGIVDHASAFRLHKKEPPIIGRLEVSNGSGLPYGAPAQA
jgi:hypothetical protein